MDMDFQIDDKSEPERRERLPEFKFKVEAKEADLGRQSNPVTVELEDRQQRGYDTGQCQLTSISTSNHMALIRTRY